jgi:hypothetical protein
VLVPGARLPIALSARRGFADEAKRDKDLAARYLQPLKHYGTVEFRRKGGGAAAATDGGERARSLTVDLTRVTPPRPGTAVYPANRWQLPG